MISANVNGKQMQIPRAYSLCGNRYSIIISELVEQEMFCNQKLACLGLLFLCEKENGSVLITVAQYTGTLTIFPRQNFLVQQAVYRGINPLTFFNSPNQIKLEL